MAAHIGILIHKYLELIALDGLEAWPLERLHHCQPAMQHWFVQRAYTTEQAQDGAAEVLRQLDITLSSAEGQWVLFPHPEARSEWAQSTADDTSAATHVIDRTFVCDGVRWIIDYKTTASPTHSSTEAWTRQLQRYARLFGGTSPSIKIAVFSTSSGVLTPLHSLE